LKQKSEVSQVFKNFIQMIKNQFETTIERVHSDNAKDIFNQIVSSFFSERRTIHEYSCMNTPQPNGLAKRKIGHLINVARAPLLHKNVPEEYLGEVVLNATYLVNHLPSKTLNYNSFIQLLSKFSRTLGEQIILYLESLVVYPLSMFILFTGKTWFSSY